MAQTQKIHIRSLGAESKPLGSGRPALKKALTKAHIGPVKKPSDPKLHKVGSGGTMLYKTTKPTTMTGAKSGQLGTLGSMSMGSQVLMSAQKTSSKAIDLMGSKTGKSPQRKSFVDR